MEEVTRKEIALYIARAEKSLEAASLDADNNFYAAAINRAYYAIFMLLMHCWPQENWRAVSTAVFWQRFGSISSKQRFCRWN